MVYDTLVILVALVIDAEPDFPIQYKISFKSFLNFCPLTFLSTNTIQEKVNAIIGRVYQKIYQKIYINVSKKRKEPANSKYFDS